MILAFVVVIVALVMLFVARPLFSRRHSWLMAAPNGEPRIRNLLHRKDRVYAAIKELEFDYEMGKLSKEDHQQMVTRYKRRAVELIQALEEAQKEIGYDDSLVEEEIKAARLSLRQQAEGLRRCPECGCQNTPDSKFCSDCGVALTARCPHCEGSVGRDSRFCNHCGATLKES